MEIGATTDVGRVRELNEDTVLARTLPQGVGNPWCLTAVLLVADGLGGHQAGEVASRLAGEMIQNMFVVGQTDYWVPDDVTVDAVRQRISEALQQINQIVHGQSAGTGGTARPATTLTLCLTRGGEYHIGHVGDTRAYLIRNGNIQQVTQDDSWVGEAVRRGQMTEDEAQSSPFRNQLLKTIGTASSVEPSLYSGDLHSDDVLLLCSDGLTEYISPDEMVQQIAIQATLQEACDYLVAAARERGGHDNISLVSASPRDRTAKRRKPATLPNGSGAARPALGRERTVRDPNQSLRVLLLGFLGLAALILGLWLGRHLAHRAVETPKPTSILAAPASRRPAAAGPATKPFDAGAGRAIGKNRRHHRHTLSE